MKIHGRKSKIGGNLLENGGCFSWKFWWGIPLFLEELRVFGDHWYLQMPLENFLGVVTVCNGIRYVLQVKGYTWNKKSESHDVSIKSYGRKTKIGGWKKCSPPTTVLLRNKNTNFFQTATVDSPTIMGFWTASWAKNAKMCVKSQYLNGCFILNI